MIRLTTATLLTAALISGCGWMGLRDRGDDYQYADSMPPLRIPEGVSVKRQEELYEVPQIGNDQLEPGKFETPRPQPLAVNVGLDRVRIQKLGNRRWILVNNSPDEVWPQMHYFLRSVNLQLESSDASAGTMETTWLTFGESPTSKDKYRLQVESGVQPDTTEIHVRHVSLPLDAPASGPVDWPTQSSDAEREGWMIDELSSALAAEDMVGAGASLVAQAIGGGTVKVQLVEPAGREPHIAMGLTMDRARATLAHALNTGAYKLHREDADSGLFYVTFDESREASEEGGWFSSWRSKREDKLAQQADAYTVEQLLANIDSADPLFAGTPGLGGAPDSNIPGYLVLLRGSGDQIEVRVRDTRGKPLARGKAAQLLMAIRQNLI